MNNSIKEADEKIDYFSILKRRKRTIENFIEEFQIKSIEDLKICLDNLNKDYKLSDEFVKIVTQTVEAKIHNIEDVKHISNFVENLPDNKDIEEVKPVQNNKKRTKKQTNE